MILYVDSRKGSRPVFLHVADGHSKETSSSPSRMQEIKISDWKPTVLLIYLHASGSRNHKILSIDHKMRRVLLKFGECTC